MRFKCGYNAYLRDMYLEFELNNVYAHKIAAYAIYIQVFNFAFYNT